MTEFDKGDSVLIDLDECRSKGYEVRNFWNAVDYAIGRVESVGITRIELTLLQEDNPEANLPSTETKAFVREEVLISGCKSCNSRLVYHDRKKDWICPFCSL